MLLDYLRELGSIPPPSKVVDSTPLGRIKSDFTHYLVAERGLLCWFSRKRNLALSFLVGRRPTV